MRNNIRFVTAFLIVFGMFASWVPASEAIINIMPLGDSITRGTGSSGQFGYRRELDFNLFDNNYNFDLVGSLIEGVPNDFDRNHEGHGGWTTDEILNGRLLDPLDGNLTIWLPDYQPDIILLHIGTNDIGDPLFDLSADDVEAILDYIDSYENANQPIWVILALIINRNCTPPSTSCDNGEDLDTGTFNDNVAAMARNRINTLGDKLLVVDMEDGAGIDYDLDMDDGVHPNDDGYTKMATEWFDAIQDVTLPNADAGSDQTIAPGATTVNLSGFNSSDPDGMIATYAWVKTAGAPLTLSGATTPTPTATLDSPAVAGETLTFQLTVTDNEGLQSSDTVSVNVVAGGGGGGGGGGGCFIAAASDGGPLPSYFRGLGNIIDQSMGPGNPISLAILFALCLCAGIGLKYGVTVQGFRGSGFKG